MNVVLGLYFDPDHDPKVRAAVRAEFVRALREFPDWAVQRAFDGWVKTMQRRPTPGEIAILAQREVKPLVEELDYRKRQAEAAAEREAAKEVVSAEAASAILHQAGFTPRRFDAMRAAPMATSFSEAEAATEAPSKPHWSERVAADSPEWRTLRAARDANPLVQAARAAAERRGPEEGAA